MEVALRQEAETFFEPVSCFEDAHSQALADGKVYKYYLLLVAKYLPEKTLSPKIVKLYEAGSINWALFINAVWSYSLALDE